MPAVDPRPEQWTAWEDRLRDAEDPSLAARAVGSTCSAFMRANAGRHGELLLSSSVA